MIIRQIRLGGVDEDVPIKEALYYVQTSKNGFFVKSAHPHVELTTNLFNAQGFFSKFEAEEVVSYLNKHFKFET